MNGIEAVLQRGVAEGRAPGVVGIVAGRDGVRAAAAAGRRGVEDATPMQVDDVFRIFSMTKAIGAAAAALLVEDGALDLDAPVGDILPEFDEVPLLEGFDGDRPRLRAPASRATIRQLASHSSGLVYEFWNAEVARYFELTGKPSILSGTRAALRSYPLAFEPGTRWGYGVGIDWLGLAVEALAGERIDAFCRRRLFEPLGMADTAFECEGALAARLVGAQRRGAEGFAPQTIAPPARPEFYGMGHALYSTGPDYVRFLRMLLRGGELDGRRVMREETVALLTANQIGALEVEPMISTNPVVSADVRLFPGTTLKHSLGFVANLEDVEGRRRAGAQGWAGLLNTHFWFDPAADVAGVILMQHLPFAEPGAMALYDAFERAAYAGAR